MKKEDLIIDEIYIYQLGGDNKIFKYKGVDVKTYAISHNDRFEWFIWNFKSSPLLQASFSDKRWFLACEKADKFVSKEEALKSVKPQFEVGKWYKGLGFDKEYIAKFHYLTAKKFTFTECISPITGYSKTNAYLEIYDNVIECPLSEIQQYLPDGHKDKIQSKVQSLEEILEICKKKYPIGSIVKCLSSNKPQTIIANIHVDDNNIWADVNNNCRYVLLYKNKTKEYAEIISLPEPTKYPDLSFKDFGVNIHKSYVPGKHDISMNPYQQELENVIWSNTMSIHRETSSVTGSAHKSNELEYQYPVINVRSKKKSKLIIINQ